MPSILKSRGGRVSSNILTAGGTNPGIPDFVFPSISLDISAASAVYAAFTMTGTSATITLGTEGVLTPSGCTLNEYSNIKPNMESATLFFATARRKAGTTGSIAAQTIIFSSNSVAIGRVTVPVTAAGLDPVCGYVANYFTTGDTRFNLATHPLGIAVTAADPDLEIVVWTVGPQD